MTEETKATDAESITTNPDTPAAPTVAELAQKKADELSRALNVKVHPVIFKENADSPEIIGFIKEPSRMVKLAVLDKSISGGSFSAAAQMLDGILIKEHSDPRIYSEKSEDDEIYIGTAMAAFALVKFSVNTLKKK